MDSVWTLCPNVKGCEEISLIIKIDEIKSVDHLSKAISYIMNEKKTNGLTYSNSGIESKQIAETFFQTKKHHSCRGNREAYHYKFSFSKDEEINAKNAFIFIQEWVENYLGDDYDYVFSVHQDREHMHMHLVFNSVCRNGGKFRHENGDWNKIIKPLTNELARKYHTGPLKEKDPALDYSTNYDKKKQDSLSWKEIVQRDMDDCIKQSKSYMDFKRRLRQDFHYQVREGVSKEYGIYLALTPPGKGKAIRSYRLDPGYMPKEIEDRIYDARQEKVSGWTQTNELGQIMRTNYRKNMDWATSRNYTFIPYKELTDVQKALVRKALDARRMYQRTGTSLQMHEQSIRAIQGMTKEVNKYGTIHKKRSGGQSVQRELNQTIGKRSKQKKERGSRNTEHRVYRQ